jgi:ABC-type branched-subunit amino acid transport system permease subunit
VTNVPYFISTGITVLVFVTLAVAFDLVVGRIGALSLAQPVFFGFGAYVAALLSANLIGGFWLELVIAAVGAVILALVIGIPSFRLSLHAFAIGTLGFQLSAQLIAQNWISVTGGPLCVTRIGPLSLDYPGGAITVSDYTGLYYVILAIAACSIALTLAITRLNIGLAFTAVRDDPVLASARGFSPTAVRLTALALSAVLSAAAGAFTAHFQTVICPDSLDISYTVALLIMVFIGGRGSLRGVVSAAVLFTVLPQVLRAAAEWRLAIYGLALLVVVTTVPDGLEQIYQAVEKALRRVRRNGTGDDSGPAPRVSDTTFGGGQ